MLNKRVHTDYSSIDEPKSEFTEITIVGKMERDVKSSTVRQPEDTHLRPQEPSCQR